MGGIGSETCRAPDPSIRSQPECLQTQIRYQGNFLPQRRNQRITLKSRSAGEQNIQMSRMCDISRVEAVSLLKMTVHKQFCCARTVWKDTMTHRAVTYFSKLPARRVIMSVVETTAGLGSKLYMAWRVFKRVVLRILLSDRSQSLQTQIKYQGNFLSQRRNQRITLKSRFTGNPDFHISRMCDISRVEAVSLLKMTVHKQFCCACTVWKDAITHRAETYFSKLPARRAIMSA